MNLKKHSSRGFTLIEVIIAIGIFTMVIGAIYSSWTLILRASHVAQEAAARVQRQRVAIHTIEDALTGVEAYQADLEYYSFIVQNGQQPLLCFTARLPDDFPRNGKFGDFNVRRLAFTLEPVAKEAGSIGTENDLVLRQFPILMGMDPDEQSTPFVLARNVKTFAVECLDSNGEWADEWDDTNSIPQLIRVSLEFGGNNPDNFGNSASTWSVTRVIAVPSQMMPAVLQRGGAPGTVPGGGQPGEPHHPYRLYCHIPK